MMAGRNVARRLSGRARRDRSDAPKGQKNLAQGFNPGSAVLTKCALKAAPEFGAPGRISDLPRCRWIHNLLAPPSGRGSFTTNPGLKPWATLFCPFGAFNPLRGCNSRNALLIGLTRLFCKQQRSSTSTSTNAERRTPNAKRLVRGILTARNVGLTDEIALRTFP
jgi:hypothetical protein